MPARPRIGNDVGVPVIATTALTMQFGSQRALDMLDLAIEHGVTGLVGANGAGKTTLMSILLGLRRSTSGSASVLGLDPTTQGAQLRALVGYGPERNVLPEDMPASDFVKHFAEVRGMPTSEARGRASDALWLVGLGEERFRALGTMSTGQRQRVKLAQAVAADPSIVFLDEPTDGLDPVQRDEMLTLIRQISADYGIDVLLSSHLLEEVERICDNVVALDAGRLVAQGALADLVGNDEGVTVELVEIDDVPDSIAAVHAALRARGLEVRAHDRSSAFDVIAADTVHDPDGVADAVRDAVADAGARIGRVANRRRRLEDLFEQTASGTGR
jgi:ABC-2 type transport system ATP-binding protein